MVLFFFWLFLGAMGCWQTSCFESQAVYVGFWDLGSFCLCLSFGASEAAGQSFVGQQRLYCQGATAVKGGVT